MTIPTDISSVTCHRVMIAAVMLLGGQADQAFAKEKDRSKLWQKEMAQFEHADAESPAEPGGIVFVGSSSIRLWDLAESFPAIEPTPLNRGFGGSHLEGSIRHAELLILRHKPRLVIVYAGDNDIAAGKDADRVLADYQKLVQIIHAELPDTSIAYIAIKPSIARWHLADTMRPANEKIAAECEDNDRLLFVDIWTPMLGEEGQPRPELFVDDGLHLNDTGYDLWAELVGPLLEKHDVEE
ncbi:MAG: SGNH/GDSL hydrolase family protein [Aeoliella sp.]